MGSIARYIFRTTTTAFVVVLVSLTAVIWVTQALRDIDLMTNRGQSVFVFVGITGMIVPLLVLVIAPIALFIATAHTLNKLSNDSEIIVMNASGMSPWLLFRAFVPVVMVVTLLVAAMSAYFAPKGLRMLRDWLTAVNANVVSTIVQPGRFVSIVGGVTIHIAAREPSGQLRGVFLDDRRNPNEHLTVVADRGELMDNQQGTFLVMRNGTIQRKDASRNDPNIVVFDRYAIDLAQFSRGASAAVYSVRERYLWQLLFPDAKDLAMTERRGEFRAEMIDRLTALLYPFAFIVIVFAYLGLPRTTRQSRTMSLFGAIAALTAVRLLGFASTVMGVRFPWLLSVQYVALATAIGGGLYVIHRGIILEPPAFVTNAITLITERFSHRFAAS